MIVPSRFKSNGDNFSEKYGKNSIPLCVKSFLKYKAMHGSAEEEEDGDVEEEE
jgi:hypothetical protein